MKKKAKNEKVKITPIISFFVRDNESSPSEELFGTLKGKFKKSTQQMKDELRKELYDD